jgi:hypothetical protein
MFEADTSDLTAKVNSHSNEIVISCKWLSVRELLARIDSEDQRSESDLIGCIAVLEMRTLVALCTILISCWGSTMTAEATSSWCAVTKLTSDGFVSLREGPSAEYGEVTKLVPSDYLSINTARCQEADGRILCDETGEWVFVQHVSSLRKQSNVTGWTSSRFLTQVACPDDQSSDSVTPQKEEENPPKTGALEADITSMTSFRGKCRFQVVKGFSRCENAVLFIELENKRAILIFAKDKDIFELSGGSDRQPNLENYFLSIDTVRTLEDSHTVAQSKEMEGECHFKLNKQASKFYFIKCDVYNRTV